MELVRDCINSEQETRFWSKVDRSGGPDVCWEWKAGKDNYGYGVFNLNSKRIIKSHRAAFLLKNTEIPTGVCVCHACDNRLCCNPAHLWLGTNRENTKDRHLKKRDASGDKHGTKTHPETVRWGDNNPSKQHPERLPRGEEHWTRKTPEKLARGDRNGARRHPENYPKGEAHYRAKLSVADVLKIRRLKKQGLKQSALAARFKVPASNISSIVLKKTWKHVEDIL